MADAAQDPAVPARRRKSGATTIYDIAKLAGVNPSTVSRALNQPGRVSQKTEARIRAAAAELDFHINPLARALPTGRTNTLALIVADITNPVVFDIIRGAEHAASIAGYTLIISESQESGALEASTAERVAPAVDGIILGTSRLPDEDIARLAQRKPLITLNREVPGVPHLAADPTTGVEQLVAHLDALGHQSIAFLGGPRRSWMSGWRWRTLLEASRARGLSIFEIGPHSPTLAAGAAAFELAEASGATALVAYNDLVAIGLIQEAKRRGVRIPEDVSVSGFDDIFGSELVTPALTTVRSDLLGLGNSAVQHLLVEIGAQADVRDSAQDATALVIRQSTGAARAR